MTRRAAILLLLLACALPAAAGDRDFDAVVKGIESHYGVRRLHPRLIGFTLFLAKPAMWGSGVAGLKVAAFEDENRTFKASVTELDQIVAARLGPEWQPFVRVDSRRDREATVIYTSFTDKHMQMLIASVESDGVSVVHLKISRDGIRKWMADPENEARHKSHGEPGRRARR